MYLWLAESVERLQWGKYLRVMLVYFAVKAWIWISIFLWGKNAHSNITASPGSDILCACWVADAGSLQTWQKWCTALNTKLTTSEAIWGERNSLFSSTQVSSSSMGDAEPGMWAAPFHLPWEPAGAHEMQGDILSSPSRFEHKAKKSLRNASSLNSTLSVGL